MIRRFFADGLIWVAIAGAIVGVSVYALYFTTPDTAVIVVNP
jgi:hypothetical protein